MSLRRRAFDEGSLPSILSCATHMTIQFQNDVYAKVCHERKDAWSKVTPLLIEFISGLTIGVYLVHRHARPCRRSG